MGQGSLTGFTLGLGYSNNPRQPRPNNQSTLKEPTPFEVLLRILLSDDFGFVLPLHRFTSCPVRLPVSALGRQEAYPSSIVAPRQPPTPAAFPSITLLRPPALPKLAETRHFTSPWDALTPTVSEAEAVRGKKEFVGFADSVVEFWVTVTDFQWRLQLFSQQTGSTQPT
ncbi:hypothetical protein QC761_0066240 [Podospora bellae-mahoneyi]|uniref:Uncharacterized protein n=1 Tax=Podospora bellae-mahoneyi TaxID=2093777 RepID=A0ABR0FJQ0_9PEZI|nr:hypothetical protein QC761_0066240 [Podospora bellae-mahoneyi]